MAQLLKQSTASQAALLGPFVDDTDGATPETGLTIANTDIRLSANGGNMAAKNSGGGTHDENGWYAVTFDATDTAAVGRLQVSCKVAGALTVFMDFDVVEEAVYDDLYAASAAGYAGIAELATLDTVADGIQTDLSNATDGLGALKTLIDAVNTDLSNGTDGLGALKTLIDAVNTDLANGTDGLGALKVLINAVNTDLSNGTDGLGALKTLIDAIQVVTDQLPNSGALSDLAAILARIPTSLVGGRMDSNLGAISNSTLAVANLLASLLSMVTGTVSTSSQPATNTTFQTTDITEATGTHFNGRILAFWNTNDALYLQITDITNYELNAGEGKFTFTALTDVPAHGTQFVII